MRMCVGRIHVLTLRYLVCMCDIRDHLLSNFKVSGQFIGLVLVQCSKYHKCNPYTANLVVLHVYCSTFWFATRINIEVYSMQ